MHAIRTYSSMEYHMVRHAYWYYTGKRMQPHQVTAKQSRGRTSPPLLVTSSGVVGVRFLVSSRFFKFRAFPYLVLNMFHYYTFRAPTPLRYFRAEKQTGPTAHCRHNKHHTHHPRLRPASQPPTTRRRKTHQQINKLQANKPEIRDA